VKVIELQWINDSQAVAIVDDPQDGSTKLVVLSSSGEPAVVLDFDVLVGMETLQLAGPAESKRVAEALSPDLWDS